MLFWDRELTGFGVCVYSLSATDKLKGLARAECADSSVHDGESEEEFTTDL